MNNINMSDVFHTPVHAGDIPRLRAAGAGTDILKRKAAAMAINKHDSLVEENERLSKAVCQTCNGYGVVGSPPDDYFNCPDCNSLAEENEKLKALMQILAKRVYDAYEWEAMTHSAHYESDTEEQKTEAIQQYIKDAEAELTGDNNE